MVLSDRIVIISLILCKLSLSENLIRDTDELDNLVLFRNESNILHLVKHQQESPFPDDVCPLSRLNYEMSFYRLENKYKILTRLKDLRKLYPGENFDFHEKTTCQDEDDFCEHLANFTSVCYGIHQQFEEFNQKFAKKMKGWTFRDPSQDVSWINLDIPDCILAVIPYETVDVSYQTILNMALRCRLSCQKRLSSIKEVDLPAEVKTLGGYASTIIEPFGTAIDICDVSQGFDYKARVRLISILGSQIQAAWVPKIEKNGTRYLFQFHEVGFEKTKIPRELYSRILTSRKRRLLERASLDPERCDPGMSNCQRILVSSKSQECHLVSNENYWLLELDQTTLQRVFEELLPLAEKWINNRIELVGTSVYGIRRYKRGAWLMTHQDHLKSHVISAILNIAQDVDKDWPLQIMDHAGNQHRIFLKPGEMVWYESAKLLHARMEPLEGKTNFWKYYENLFVHYMPRSLSWYTEDFTVQYIPEKNITLEHLEEEEKKFIKNREKMLQNDKEISENLHLDQHIHL